MDFNGVVSKMMQYSSFWFVSGCPLEGRIVALKTKKQLYQKKKKDFWDFHRSLAYKFI